MLWGVEFAGQGGMVGVLGWVGGLRGGLGGVRGGCGCWWCWRLVLCKPGGRFIGPISFWLGTRTLWRPHSGTYAGVAVDVLLRLRLQTLPMTTLST